MKSMLESSSRKSLESGIKLSVIQTISQVENMMKDNKICKIGSQDEFMKLPTVPISCTIEYDTGGRWIDKSSQRKASPRFINKKKNTRD